jgi:predicted Zn-dependent protease with MMP-like domain
MKNSPGPTGRKGRADSSKLRAMEIPLEAFDESPPEYDDITREVHISQDDFHAHVELLGNKPKYGGISSRLILFR